MSMVKPVMPLMRIEPDDFYQRVQPLVLDILTSHRPWNYAARILHLFAHMYRSVHASERKHRCYQADKEAHTFAFVAPCI